MILKQRTVGEQGRIRYGLEVNRDYEAGTKEVGLGISGLR